MIFPSCSIQDKPNFAVVTNSEDLGFGVFSWHVASYEANANAKIVGGKVVPVDYIDGEIILPPLAKKIVRTRLNLLEPNFAKFMQRVNPNLPYIRGHLNHECDNEQ